MGACEKLSSYLDPNDFSQLLLPILEALQDDTSWRVRRAFCQHAALICRHSGEANASRRILPLYARLLRDKEVPFVCVSLIVVDCWAVGCVCTFYLTRFSQGRGAASGGSLDGRGVCGGQGWGAGTCGTLPGIPRGGIQPSRPCGVRLLGPATPHLFFSPLSGVHFLARW